MSSQLPFDSQGLLAREHFSPLPWDAEEMDLLSSLPMPVAAVRDLDASPMPIAETLIEMGPDRREVGRTLHPDEMDTIDGAPLEEEVDWMEEEAVPYDEPIDEAAAGEETPVATPAHLDPPTGAKGKRKRKEKEPKRQQSMHAFWQSKKRQPASDPLFELDEAAGFAGSDERARVDGEEPDDKAAPVNSEPEQAKKRKTKTRKAGELKEVETGEATAVEETAEETQPPKKKQKRGQKWKAGMIKTNKKTDEVIAVEETAEVAPPNESPTDDSALIDNNGEKQGRKKKRKQRVGDDDDNNGEKKQTVVADDDDVPLDDVVPLNRLKKARTTTKDEQDADISNATAADSTTAEPTDVTTDETPNFPGMVIAKSGIHIESKLDALRCGNCQSVIDLDNGKTPRLFGKCKGQFICRVCETRNVQLYKTGSGKEFLKKFKSFSKEDQTAFWQALAKPGMKLEEVAETMDDFLEKYHKEEEVSHVGGCYQPLGWYERQGYDIELIQEKCKDIQEHPVFGKTYRVEITGGGLETRSGSNRVQSLNGSGSSSSNGGAPSSAISRGKSGNCAADKQAAQQSAAQQKAEFATLQKNMKRMKEDAGKIMAKLTTEHFLLSNLLKSKDMKGMPDNVIAKVKLTQTKMQQIIKECENVLNGKQHHEVAASLQEATQLAKTGVLQRDFVNNLVGQQKIQSMP